MNQFTMDKIPYFDIPIQVIFFDMDSTTESDKPFYRGGIAYRDEIICGCCGGVFEIKDIWHDGICEGVQPIFVFDDWIDISEAITGDTDLTNTPVIEGYSFGQIEQYIPKNEHPNN